MHMAEKTVVIANPLAKAGYLKKKWPVIEPILKRELGDCEVLFTKAVGDGIPLARHAVERGATLVVAMGGDGTVSEVTSGLLAHQEATHADEPVADFGYIPAGTGGDLRRTLALPTEIEAAARHVRTTKGRLIDAGRIEFVGHDGRPQRRYFLNVASVGVSGLVDQLVMDASKLLGGKVAYFWASLRGTLQFKNALVRLKLDDKPQKELRMYLVAVANGRYFGSGMMVAPKAVIDDGQLDVVVMGDFSFPEKVSLVQKIYQWTHDEMPKVSLVRARTVRIEPAEETGPPILLDIDGEAPGRLPATWTVLPHAVRLRG